MNSVNLSSSVPYTADRPSLAKGKRAGLRLDVTRRPAAVVYAASPAPKIDAAAPLPSTPSPSNVAMGRVDAFGHVATAAGGYIVATGTATALVKAVIIHAGLWTGLAAYVPACTGAIYVCRRLHVRAREHMELGGKLNRAIELAGGYEKFQASLRNRKHVSTAQLIELCATETQWKDLQRIYRRYPGTCLRLFFEDLFKKEDDPKKVLDDLKWARHEVFGKLPRSTPARDHELAMHNAAFDLAVRRLARAEAANMSFPRRIASTLSFR